MAELFPLFATRAATRNATATLATLLNGTLINGTVPGEGGAGLTGQAGAGLAGALPAEAGMEAGMPRLEDNGGLGLTAPEVGRSLVPLGLTLFLSPIAYPHLERRMGHLGCLSLGMCTLSGALLLLPFLSNARKISIVRPTPFFFVFLARLVVALGPRERLV